MRLLFVCNQGRHRSRTAADLFSDAHETRYRGVYENGIVPGDLAWADATLCMEDHQRTEIAQRFPQEYLRSRILVLGVPDLFSYGDPALIALLRTRVPDALASICGTGASQRRASGTPGSGRRKAPVTAV